MKPVLSLPLAALLVACSSGCTWLSYFGTTEEGHTRGKVFFVGGAGPVGNVVGTFDVPRGLRAAGYPGAIETFGWQSVVGGTLRDQMDRNRNRSEARRLARRIQAYLDSHPGRSVHIVALSAGTGIATWALEALPSGYSVHTVVYLSSSLSCEYDLTEALRRIRNRLHVFYSERDPVLRYMAPVAGSVDREMFSQSIVGLRGVVIPARASPTVRGLYELRVRNHPYDEKYAQYGYFGFHADSTSAAFIEHVVAPLLLTGTDSGTPPPVAPATPPPGGP